MKKCQVLLEFIILGVILFILFLAVSYKIGVARIACYINTEHNIKKSTILSEIHCIPKPITYKSQVNTPSEDKILITTVYFSYYIPSNQNQMLNSCGKYCTQKEYSNAIFQIFNQLQTHNIKLNEIKYNQLKQSIDKYTTLANNSDTLKLEKNLDASFVKIKNELLATKSPIAKESSIILSELIINIKNLNKQEK